MLHTWGPHHGTLINVYKAKLADHLPACRLYEKVPADTWRGKFVADVEAVGDGAAVLKYLAPYFHRVAISDLSQVLSESEPKSVAVDDFKFSHSMIVTFETTSNAYVVLRVFRIEFVNCVDEKVSVPRVCTGIKVGWRFGELNADAAARYRAVRWWIIHDEIEVESKHVAVEFHSRAYVMHWQDRSSAKNLWFRVEQ